MGSRLGDYIIDGDLAGGWNLEGYEATHVVLPRRAKLIVLDAALADHAPAAVQLMREACLLDAMAHPGVPRVFGCGVVARRPWIACELIEGTPLSEQLASGRALPVHDVLALLRDAAEVLEHAHRRGVVHRNLRPEVLVRTRGRAFPLCITGWSDARLHDAEAALIDLRDDVLALGTVAFTALTGARPCDELSATERCPGAPRKLTRLIDRMLAEDPEARPSCAEVRAIAMDVLELTEVEMPVEDDQLIEVVSVELVDISHLPPPVPTGPAARKSRWTPAHGHIITPPQPLAAIQLARKPNR
ncbi:MAG: protein kinase [Myxococcales bacterium]|nr:protein kinase [Myxococcales bacterium]